MRRPRLQEGKQLCEVTSSQGKSRDARSSSLVHVRVPNPVLKSPPATPLGPGVDRGGSNGGSAPLQLSVSSAGALRIEPPSRDGQLGEANFLHLLIQDRSHATHPQWRRMLSGRVERAPPCHLGLEYVWGPHPGLPPLPTPCSVLNLHGMPWPASPRTIHPAHSLAPRGLEVLTWALWGRVWGEACTGCDVFWGIWDGNSRSLDRQSMV